MAKKRKLKDMTLEEIYDIETKNSPMVVLKGGQYLIKKDAFQRFQLNAELHYRAKAGEFIVHRIALYDYSLRAKCISKSIKEAEEITKNETERFKKEFGKSFRDIQFTLYGISKPLWIWKSKTP